MIFCWLADMLNIYKEKNDNCLIDNKTRLDYTSDATLLVSEVDLEHFVAFPCSLFHFLLAGS